MEDEELDEFKLEDAEILSRLKRLVVNGDPLPKEFFKENVDVFIKNPSMEFDHEDPVFVVIKQRTAATDGCETGCWRIIGRDKLIKSTEDGEIFGFKKVYKFCEKRNPRDYKRSWVMEEYRLNKNLNAKQDHVICKIWLLFLAEISSLLALHFRTTSQSLLSYELLPKYGYESPGPDDYEGYLMTIKFSSQVKDWPIEVTTEWYSLHPFRLANLQDQTFRYRGICIFANKTLGTDDECYGGCWRILHGEKLIKSKAGVALGFKKVFKFYETKTRTYIRNGEETEVSWTIEEYRLNDDVWKNKRLCIMKLRKITKSVVSTTGPD